MSLDVAVDAQVLALATLAQGAVNADLQTLLGEDAIDGLFRWPLALDVVPKTKLPALAVWRQRNTYTERTALYTETTARFRFDYYCEPTPVGKLEERWPLLEAVERQLIEAICAGHHTAVSGDAAILVAAEIIEIDLLNAVTNFAFVPGRNTVYPAFQMSVDITHRPVTDLSAFVELVGLHAQISDTAYPVAEQPRVEEIIPDE